MISLIRKFSQGIRTDPKNTLWRSLQYILHIFSILIADMFYYILRVLVLPLPSRTLGRLKHTLSPKVRLDYGLNVIKLNADSLLDFYRARACEKEPETVHWIETYVKPGQVFFDIGANVGAYSLIASAFHQGNIIVHAFEPSFSNYYQLCRNIILNGFQKSIVPHMVGLTNSNGMITFHYRSLDAGSADHWLGAPTPDSSSTQFVYNQQIFGFRIDYLIERFELPVPNHIKLDVDGTELGVLNGAKRTLCSEDLKSILVEVRDTGEMSSKVDEILVSNGFSSVSKTNRGDGITWNCIYVR